MREDCFSILCIKAINKTWLIALGGLANCQSKTVCLFLTGLTKLRTDTDIARTAHSCMPEYELLA